MRSFALLLAAASLAGCATSKEENEAEPDASSRYTFWRPAPVADAPDPNAAVSEAPASAWRTVAPENLLVMELKEGGRVVIELAPDFAPVHIANVRAYAKGGWWNGAAIYRVQDNYVAQWGNGDSNVPLPAGVVKTPPAEYSRDLAGLDVRPLGYPDSYAPMVGHVDGKASRRARRPAGTAAYCWRTPCLTKSCISAKRSFWVWFAQSVTSPVPSQLGVTPTLATQSWNSALS